MRAIIFYIAMALFASVANGSVVITYCDTGYTPLAGDTCIDTSLCPTTAWGSMCSFIWSPICGCDGVTYGNPCYAKLNAISTYTEGECPKATPATRLRKA